MDTLSKTRDLVAHTTWVRGRGPGAIKPHQLKAFGKLKLFGVAPNEQEFTPGSLWATYGDMRLSSSEFSKYLREHARPEKDDESAAYFNETDIPASERMDEVVKRAAKMAPPRKGEGEKEDGG